MGVHIADVSYFVRAGSALDSAALDRATSTYLVERVVPMLPRPLCEKLCSLNPHENRLTFSVEWTINEKVARLTFSQYPHTTLEIDEIFIGSRDSRAFFVSVPVIYLASISCIDSHVANLITG